MFCSRREICLGGNVFFQMHRKFSPQRFRKYSIFWKLVFGVFALDQLSKLLVIALIPWKQGQPTYAFPGMFGYAPGFEPITVIPNFFYLVHIDNPGAAWSLFAGQQVFLSIFALVALVCIFLFRRNLELERRPSQISLGLLAGGIAGNLLDRVCHNYVIDFLDVHLPFYGRWPAFNFADCGIVIGVVLYIFISVLPLFGTNHPAAKRFNEEDALR